MPLTQNQIDQAIAIQKLQAAGAWFLASILAKQLKEWIECEK